MDENRVPEVPRTSGASVLHWDGRFYYMLQRAALPVHFNAQQIDDEQVVSKYAEWTRSRPAAAPKRGPAVEVKWPKVEDVIPEAERAPKTTAPESRARRKKTSQVKEKKEIPAPRSVFVVEASYPDGAFIAKAEVERTADAVAAQIEAFSRKYPDCVCKVKEPKVEIDLDELPF